MSTKTLTAAVLAASISGFASAGILTMTASSTTGSDGWAGLSGYSMSLTIDCNTLSDAGSSSAFVLNSWSFVAKDVYGDVKFSASGSGQVFTVAPGSGKFMATIGLNPSNVLVNDMVPQADSIAFGYAFTSYESLMNAIEASAGTVDGMLQLGSDTGATGLLTGMYAVPAPGAAALLGLGGLIGRRRKA
ncbi:MAG: hypothetical protein ACOYMI_00030 [Phycisphaerales bacterium]|jgi:hypothetical protein